MRFSGNLVAGPASNIVLKGVSRCQLCTIAPFTLSTQEADLIRRAVAGEAEAVRQIIKIHNQRLYRLVRAVVRSNADAEDVLQEAYLRAFTGLGTFKGSSSLSTWLSRIAFNAALMRLRAQKRLKRAAVTLPTEAQIIPFPLASPTADPERVMAARPSNGPTRIPSRAPRP